ncbi:MAG TPA: PIN domain-containing protein [Thermoanaerobaculia bacterium]|nr:PIN domain-containing protein [Thermoanaerobaculia bacterium]
MGPDSYVLDTSAIMALIEEEEGAARVQEVLEQESTILPWLVLMEVYYVTQQEKGSSEADRRYALLRQLPAEVPWNMDEATVLTAARFKAEFRLSLADALIAAFARRREATLLHKDPEFEALAGQIELEALPYKSPH